MLSDLSTCAQETNAAVPYEPFMWVTRLAEGTSPEEHRLAEASFQLV